MIPGLRSLPLAYPRLNSVAAPRLVEPDIHDESLRRDFAYTLGRIPNRSIGVPMHRDVSQLD